MAKRKTNDNKAATRTIMCPRTDCRNVFQIPDTSAHDAETVRLVREIAEAWDRWNGTSGFERGVKRVAEDILTILNRPAKKGKKNG